MERKKIGRPLDDVWEHYTQVDGNGDKRFRCNYCGKEYNSPACVALRGHLSNSTFARKYKTTLCAQNSLDVQSLKIKFTRFFEMKYGANTNDADGEVKVCAPKLESLIHAFFDEYNIPISALQSKCFVEMCKAIEQNAITKSSIQQIQHVEYSPLFLYSQENLPLFQDQTLTDESFDDILSLK